MSSHLDMEIIDAFVDGERVDAAALKAALADSQGRDYLVDAWLLREGVQDAMAGDASAPAVVPMPRAASRGVPWVLAASAAVVCLVSGYFVGHRPEAPAARTPATAPAVVEVAKPDTSFPMPEPTRRIRVELNPSRDNIGGG